MNFLLAPFNNIWRKFNFLQPDFARNFITHTSKNSAVNLIYNVTGNYVTKTFILLRSLK